MRRRAFLLTAAAAMVAPAGCAAGDAQTYPYVVRPTKLTVEPRPASPEAATGGSEPTDQATEPPDLDPADYPATAAEWGEGVTGVRTRLDTGDPVVALTFDACGGQNGSGYDEELVEYLRAESIAATLFINKRWIAANGDVFGRLADDPLFEVANHGTEHRPLSVTGRSVYGVTGTADPAAVIDEVMVNQEAIVARTGRPAAHFRSGTAYYDEVAVRIVNDLGLEVVGFDVLGDAGATYSAAQVAAALETCTAGSIALLHMNQPASGTAAGVKAVVPTLRDRGLRFGRLGDYALR